MARLIRVLKPRAIMMENVPGLGDKGKRLYNEFLRTLDDLGYKPTDKTLQVADYGVPQNRRRLVLLAGRGFSIPLPPETHARLPKVNQLRWANVRSVLSGFPKPVSIVKANSSGGPQEHAWHVVREISPLNKNRLRHAKPGASWRKIPKRLRPVCHQDRQTGFPNVYGRMKWTDLSPTITGGSTTPSKGRFGHPSQLRTISVREAAFIQTFPPEYVFDTEYMEHACNIIGNALPCDFAEVLARQCYLTIRETGH
jgi:DNA (cytosine-5)-methyltransferase 1